MTRRKVSAEELHDILEREFRRTAGELCPKCRIPMPAYLDPGSRGGPNWRIGSAGECANLCHTLLEDLVAAMAAKYDLAQPRKIRS
jgi:hypothetical protein